MKLYDRKEECCGCGACAAVCRRHAITMRQDREGFYYPAVNEKICVNCGECFRACPLKNETKNSANIGYYGARNTEEAVRERSSSGGIFSVFANYVLEKNGAVFAAGYDSKMRVVHMEVRKPEELDKVRRTKYVQSDMGTIYQQISDRLQEGMWVLFVGTPCQTEALRRYLKKDFQILITVSLICYGAASPGIWQRYIRYLSRKYKSPVREYNFRDKRNRDNGHTVSWKNGKGERAYSLYDDLYCRMYFRNLIIRPSCHRCPFCTTERSSDFTIGDFWGIENIRPNEADGMGNSLVIIHSQKAEMFWEDVKERCRSFKCSREDILQPRLLKPTECSDRRKIFMRFYRFVPFSVISFLFEVRK